MKQLPANLTKYRYFFFTNEGMPSHISMSKQRVNEIIEMSAAKVTFQIRNLFRNS